MGSEAGRFSDDPPPYNNHHSVKKTKHYFDAYFWEEWLGFGMEASIFVQAYSKENDGVVRRFITSEHATSRYLALHGKRSHTRKDLSENEAVFIVFTFKYMFRALKCQRKWLRSELSELFLEIA